MGAVPSRILDDKRRWLTYGILRIDLGALHRHVQGPAYRLLRRST